MPEPESRRAGFCELLPDGSRIQYAACYPCHFGQHPGGWHTWADDADDVERAMNTGRPDPRSQKCGCVCADGPDLEQRPDGPDWGEVPLEASPCPVCGSNGACGYDGEGRPLIHTYSGDDDA